MSMEKKAEMFIDSAITELAKSTHQNDTAFALMLAEMTRAWRSSEAEAYRRRLRNRIDWPIEQLLAPSMN